MQQETSFQKRQTAYWMDVGELLGGSFIKGDAGTYYKTKEGVKVSRVNVFGIVLSKESSEFFEGVTVEDGTGSINVRSFEDKTIFNDVSVEDVVNIIGKIREYNGEPFISVEIIRKSDKESMDLRKKEAKLVKKFYKKEEEQTQSEDIVIDNQSEKLLGIIKELDEGDGVNIESIKKKCDMEDAESIIKELINNGDLFEIRPGKLKVLD